MPAWAKTQKYKPLPGWFGALLQWTLRLTWAFACVKEGVKACQDALCTYVPSKRWFGKFAQIGPEKKCPRVPVWVRVGGCNRYLGNAQIEVTLTSKVLPLCVLLACQLQIKKLVMSIPPFLPVMVRPAQATSLVAATAVPVCRSTGALPLVTLRTFFPAATGKVWAWNPHSWDKSQW